MSSSVLTVYLQATKCSAIFLETVVTPKTFEVRPL